MTTQTIKLTDNEAIALASLRANAEVDDHGGWQSIYIDNAKPQDWAPATWAGVLGSLAKKGLYKWEDGYAWGLVLMPEHVRSITIGS